ncbi:hypothetical protein ACTFTM_12050 [Micromonospora sp. RB23]
MTAPNASPIHDRQPLSNLHPVHQHLPRRPSWLCRVCAAPWPCPSARMLLRVEYRANRVNLSVYMAGMLFDATADLMKLNPEPGPDPGELFDRFLAWTSREDASERGPTSSGPRSAAT